MERVLDKEEERAAPIVPEERAKAAEIEGGKLSLCDLRGKKWLDVQDVFRPRFGPESCTKS